MAANRRETIVTGEALVGIQFLQERQPLFWPVDHGVGDRVVERTMGLPDMRLSNP